ncbi:Heat shock protein DnaJ [Purpureocillium lavendulum]|uniref:Heat shock protein DnaJ n=1 Tax=Purpureocillium lavendulum TaxID=1247861 RepID=A0AB34FME1_9HYPO|nr:Heat shock protein DnaJ [Purpureocillium lavendulum]
MSDDANNEPLNRTYSPSLNLTPVNSLVQRYDDALRYFQALPWLAETLGNRGTHCFLPSSRNTTSDHRDQFLNITLATDRTLEHMLCFITPEDQGILQDPSKPVAQVQTLFLPGEGLSGVGSMLHGGVIMTMLDEACNVLLEINTVLNKQGSMFEAGSVTGSMEVKFIRAVLTGGAVLATAWIDTIDGRKMRIRCNIRDEDGEELVRASSMWFVVKYHL